MEDFDQRYPHARAPERKEHWPANVRTISMNGLSMLGVDSSGRLYWDGTPVEVSRTFSLTWWQTVGAVLAIISGVIIVALDALRFFGFGLD